MGKLSIKKSKSQYVVEGEISLYEYSEDGLFFAVAPELDIVGYDRTPEGARKSLEIQIGEFIDYENKKNYLDKELVRLGWTTNQKPEYLAPTPDKLTSSELYTELLNKDSYVKNKHAIAF